MELLLVALGACTATDVVAILAKKRQNSSHWRWKFLANERRKAAGVWVKLEIVYKLRGDLTSKP